MSTSRVTLGAQDQRTGSPPPRKAESSGRPWADRLFDLRVDAPPEPLRELRRLVRLQRAYNHMNAGDAAVERKDNEAALREYAAAERLVPDNV